MIHCQTANRMTAAQYRQMQGFSDPVQAYRGKHNRDAGLEFESRIIAASEQYEEDKVAIIRKTPEPVCPIKRLEGGKFIAVYGEKIEPDFKGMLSSGQSIVFEAKYTDTDRIEKSRLTPRQEEFLESYFRMHATVFVLIGFSDGRCYRVPWTIWRDMKALYERKYLKSSDVPAYEVKCSYLDGKLGVLFLDGHATIPVLST